MGRDDGRLPAPGPTGVPRSRRPTAAVPEPRVAELSALLGEIGLLRTTLQADLSLAAAALEAGAGSLAGELVDGDIGAVRDFELRALARLRAMDDGEPAGRHPGRHPATAVSATAALTAGDTVTPQAKRRRLLPARLLPAAPLLAAAAALVGFAVGVVPERSTVQPAPAMSSAAAASHELSQLALQGAPAEQLRQAAEQLNEQVRQLIAAPTRGPATAAEALTLLQRGSEVLADSGDQRPLQTVLAQTRQLTAELRRESSPALRPVLPRVVTDPLAQQQQSSRLSPPRSKAPPLPASPATQPTTAPAPLPTSEPYPAAESAPGPAPAPTKTPRSGQGGEGLPFPAPDQLPDFG